MMDKPSAYPLQTSSRAHPDPGFWRMLLKRLSRQPSFVVGATVLTVILAMIAVGPLVLAGHPSSDFDLQDLMNSFEPPSAQHWLGTDAFGRDILVRLIQGGRYTLSIGIAAVMVGLAFGVPLGLLSGYCGGWVDMLIQRLVDIVLAFPSFLLALALIGVLGTGVTNIIFAVAITAFPRFTRLLRASVLSVKEMPFVEAGRALGTPTFRLVTREVLPNAMTPVIVQSSLEVATAILTASGLGFLGLGVAQPTPEWGAMLGEARQYIFTYPHLLTYPGLCIVAVVLTLNLIGDGFRDAMDPRLK
jgi:peptide/nickel transport system permease protein